MLLFFDVDTQRDFLLEEGALYVPGGSVIIPTLAAITSFAREQGIRVLASMDAHAPNDPEFIISGGQFPAHCVVGTRGQEKLLETTVPGAPIVPPEGLSGSRERELIHAATAVVLEKRSLDVFTNPMASELVSSQDTAIVYGVATEFCVRTAVLGLIARGLSVRILTDAVRGVDHTEARAALAEMAEAGATLMTSEEMVQAMRDGRLS
jgi:nicotinamidase/pyrazinamidase